MDKIDKYGGDLDLTTQLAFLHQLINFGHNILITLQIIIAWHYQIELPQTFCFPLSGYIYAQKQLNHIWPKMTVCIQIRDSIVP